MTSTGYLLGIDLGTSGSKAVAVGLDGALLATAEVRYPTAAPRPGWAEQDPGDWWQAACIGVRRLCSGLPPGARPVGIGATGQMHTMVALDGALAVIRPAILWSDRRSEEQAESIGRIVGEQVLMDITRNPSRGAFTASKLAWLHDHEPAAAARVRHVMLPKDWLVLQLTGELVTEPSDASGTGLFDVAAQDWSTELIDALGFRCDMLADVHPSASVVGRLRAEPAAELGLPAGVPVIAGAGDQAAAAYDAGAVIPGIVACNLGTSVALTESTTEPLVGTLSHIVADQWLFVTSVHSGTGVLDWWSRIAAAGRVGEVVTQAADSAPGARGVRFVPLLMGSRDPGPDSGATGSFLGLRDDHTTADMTRAVLEGIAFEVGRVARTLPALRAATPSWRVFGGGVRGTLLVQTLANVLRVGLQVIPQASSARGAARLVAEAVGAPLTDPLDRPDLGALVTPSETVDYGPHLVEYEAYRAVRP
jgi:xylulokinase